MTVKIKVINNKNQNMKHKDNNLQIICRVRYKEQAIFKRNLLFVWPIYTISAHVIQMLMTTKMAHQEGYLKYDVLDGKTM
jgi:hypothetical protein